MLSDDKHVKALDVDPKVTAALAPWDFIAGRPSETPQGQLKLLSKNLYVWAKSVFRNCWWV